MPAPQPTAAKKETSTDKGSRCTGPPVGRDVSSQPVVVGKRRELEIAALFVRRECKEGCATVPGCCYRFAMAYRDVPLSTEKCPGCNADVQKGTELCPHCGNPVDIARFAELELKVKPD